MAANVNRSMNPQQPRRLTSAPGQGGPSSAGCAHRRRGRAGDRRPWQLSSLCRADRHRGDQVGGCAADLRSEPACSPGYPLPVSVCSSCGAANADESRFCAACGAGMGWVCSHCGANASEDARFCPACGTRAGPEADAERQRKVISVVFADLVGYTSRSETTDAEDVRELLQHYYQCVSVEIERFGGTVEKFIGDAVMAVFGAPVARGDDAERAVRAALRSRSPSRR